ncbi:MAG: hypothetical protein HY391_06055 [Deltaproteobacteria bacterium]|nr:hypothetical protein [Deltaproteobacteria bacterium]
MKKLLSLKAPIFSLAILLISLFPRLTLANEFGRELAKLIVREVIICAKSDLVFDVTAFSMARSLKNMLILQLRNPAWHSLSRNEVVEIEQSIPHLAARMSEDVAFLLNQRTMPDNLLGRWIDSIVEQAFQPSVSELLSSMESQLLEMEVDDEVDALVIPTLPSEDAMGLEAFSTKGMQDGWIRSPLGSFYYHSPWDPQIFGWLSKVEMEVFFGLYGSGQDQYYVEVVQQEGKEILRVLKEQIDSMAAPAADVLSVSVDLPSPQVGSQVSPVVVSLRRMASETAKTVWNIEGVETLTPHQRLMVEGFDTSRIKEQLAAEERTFLGAMEEISPGESPRNPVSQRGAADMTISYRSDFLKDLYLNLVKRAILNAQLKGKVLP